MCKKANIDMVLGKTVTIKTDVIKKQKDGKLLGYVFTGNFFVNADLIKEGYAMAHNVPPNSRYKNEFLSMQHEARKNRKGLWAFEDMSSEPYYVGSRTKNVFHRPNCSHANNIAFDDKVIFRTIDDALKKNFEQDWRCCPLFKEPVKKDEKDKTN
jgi:micrococcal nuclease